MMKEETRKYIRACLGGTVAPNILKGLIERRIGAIIEALAVLVEDRPSAYDTRDESRGRGLFVDYCNKVLGPVGSESVREVIDDLQRTLRLMRSRQLDQWILFSYGEEEGEKVNADLDTKNPGISLYGPVEPINREIDFQEEKQEGEEGT